MSAALNAKKNVEAAISKLQSDGAQNTEQAKANLAQVQGALVAFVKARLDTLKASSNAAQAQSIAAKQAQLNETQSLFSGFVNMLQSLNENIDKVNSNSGNGNAAPSL